MRGAVYALSFCLALGTSVSAERINHEGRILGAEPVVIAPTLFNTPAADAIVAAMQIMPVDSAWNEDISRLPARPDSGTMIAQIRTDLGTSRQTLRPFYEMNYVLVPVNQPRLPIVFFNYPDESDLDGGNGTTGLYPIAPNTPVETWPRGTGALTLEQWQRDVSHQGGDRHSILVDPEGGSIWETWLTQLVGNDWKASNGAKFNLSSNGLRPADWTSGDAAGLPMFPALVRYDECERGMVEHALRLVVAKSRHEYIYPATHYASSIPAASTQYPAMGQRLRLKPDFVIPASWTKSEKAVLLGLKKYGAIVADNGGFFSVSICPDDRFASNAFDHLSTIDVNNFEVVQTTEATTGPRSPGAPSVDAGADASVQLPGSLTLNATVTDPSGTAAIHWAQYAGPGNVTFADASQRQTSATFSAPGSYTLIVSANDGLHAVAYDAVIVRATIPVALASSGNDFVISFPTAVSRRYRVERASDLGATTWLVVADNIDGDANNMAAVIDYGATTSAGRRFYRVLLLP